MYCWRTALLLVAIAAAFEGFADLDATAAIFARSIFVVFALSFLIAALGETARRFGETVLRRYRYVHAGAMRRRR